MVTTIKALSMWQPWASLVGLEAKRYETRSWSTNYRGPLLICSAKKKDLGSLRLLREERFQIGMEQLAVKDDLGVGIVRPRDLPYGEAIAIVDLVAVTPTSEVLGGFFADPSIDEQHFGDFTPGRFAWELVNVRPLARGWKIRGAQGLFNVELPTRIIKGRGFSFDPDDPNKEAREEMESDYLDDLSREGFGPPEDEPEPKELDPRVVSCPSCGQDVGAYCRRPSGHRAMDWHKDRINMAIEAVTELGGDDALTRTQPWGLERADES